MTPPRSSSERPHFRSCQAAGGCSDPLTPLEIAYELGLIVPFFVLTACAGDPSIPATPANSTTCWNGLVCGAGDSCPTPDVLNQTGAGIATAANGPPDPNDIPSFGKRYPDAGLNASAPIRWQQTPCSMAMPAQMVRHRSLDFGI